MPTSFFQELIYRTNANLSLPEAVCLSILALLAWFCRKNHPSIPVIFSVLLILHITLLRRAPGYDETIKIYLRLLPNAGVWAGNLLNLLLFVPFGFTARCWKAESRKIIIIGFTLSLFCETTQYLTGRGWADINDIVFNTVGTAAGVWLAKRFAATGSNQT